MGFRVGITVVQNVHFVQDLGVLAALPQKTPQVDRGRTELQVRTCVPHVNTQILLEQVLAELEAAVLHLREVQGESADTRVHMEIQNEALLAMTSRGGQQ